MQFAMLLVQSCDCLTTCEKALAVRAGSDFVDVNREVVWVSLTSSLAAGVKGRSHYQVLKRKLFLEQIGLQPGRWDRYWLVGKAR